MVNVGGPLINYRPQYLLQCANVQLANESGGFHSKWSFTVCSANFHGFHLFKVQRNYCSHLAFYRKLQPTVECDIAFYIVFSVYKHTFIAPTINL